MLEALSTHTLGHFSGECLRISLNDLLFGQDYFLLMRVLVVAVFAAALDAAYLTIGEALAVEL